MQIYTDYNTIPLVLSVQDLMPILGTGRNAAYMLVRSGQIKSISIGNRRRIPKGEVIRFLSADAQPGNA